MDFSVNTLGELMQLISYEQWLGKQSFIDDVQQQMCIGCALHGLC